MKPQVSLVFPVWNEEDTVEVYTPKSVIDGLAAGIRYEMVFVDDGSSDGSLGIIKG